MESAYPIDRRISNEEKEREKTLVSHKKNRLMTS